MAWTLTNHDTVPTVFTFNPAPSSVRETWKRDYMDFDIPLQFTHMFVDWVTTDRVIILEGTLVGNATDATSVARPIQWWKMKMQALMFRGFGVSGAQSTWRLNDGDPTTVETVVYNCFGGAAVAAEGNTQNRYGIIEQIEFDQKGGEPNVITYRITFKCATIGLDAGALQTG